MDGVVMEWKQDGVEMSEIKEMGIDEIVEMGNRCGGV